MKKSFVPISKQSKKAQKAYHSTQRSTWGILTGNADHAERQGIQPEEAESERQKRQGILLRLPAASFFFAVSSIAVSPFP